MARYQLFSAGDVPASFGSGAASNTGTAFKVTAAADLTAIRFYKGPSDTATTHTVVLWDISAHTNLVQKASSGEPASGWIEVTLTTPYTLTVNKAYYVTVFNANAWFNYTASYFTSADKVVGPITAYKNGTVPGGVVNNNGVYDPTSSITYPGSGFDACYWVDPVVTSGGGVGQTFPMAIADTSTVTALGYRITKRFALAIADVSTVVALAFRVTKRFALTVADVSTVTALGLSIATGGGAKTFPLSVADTSTVTSLGFHLTVPVSQSFPISIADTSTVTVLGYRIGKRFALSIADTSTVTALKFRVLSLKMNIVDTCTVTALRFTLEKEEFGYTDVIFTNAPKGITANKLNLAFADLSTSVGELSASVEERALPVGSVIMFLSVTPPVNWMVMDGRAVSRALYPKLFTLIGTVFGAGDGSTTFNIPDGRGRVAIGAGQGAGLTNRVMGAAGGQESHIITAAEMASHTHVQNAHGHSVNSLWSAGGTYAAGSTIYVFGAAGGSAYTPLTTTVTATNQNTGGDTAHNNMQPFMVWQWILKVL